MLACVLRKLTLGAIVVFASSPLAAAAPASYRQFSLGSSTADVVTRTGAPHGSVKTLHERPAVLQELAWRPPPTMPGDARNRDSVTRIVFGFVDDQLFKIVVEYDRRSTEGLTKDDMVASLSAIYGPPSPAKVPPAGRSSLDSVDAPTAIARWRQNDATILLQHFAYSDRFGMVMVSAPLDTIAKRAEAAALVLDAREAPAHERARAKTQVEAERAAAQKTRTTNRAAFNP